MSPRTSCFVVFSGKMYKKGTVALLFTTVWQKPSQSQSTGLPCPPLPTSNICHDFRVKGTTNSRFLLAIFQTLSMPSVWASNLLFVVGHGSIHKHALAVVARSTQNFHFFCQRRLRRRSVRNQNCCDTVRILMP